MTSSFLDRNIVIASVQTDGQEIIPNYQSGSEFPTTRGNGGDLMPGDVYYDSGEDVYYNYDGVMWVPIGGPGILNEILARLDKIEEDLATLLVQPV